MKFITIYVTHKNLKQAKKIVKPLLENRLIACANYYPIDSTYNWNKKIVKETEIVSLLKTKPENWWIVKTEIEKNHPYEIPCIIKNEVESNEKYAKWIYKETKEIIKIKK